MLRINNHGLQSAGFKDVVQRLPIGCCALHGDHLAAAFLQPVSHFKKLSGCRTKVTDLLPVALFKAGYDQLLVQVNTTAFVVNLIHNGTSQNKFTARLPVFYYFTLRPYMPYTAEQMVVQMRKP